MADLTPDPPKLRRIAAIGTAFRPGAPVNRLDLFRGRTLELQEVITAVSQDGQHVALYGDRGVGKTSLANVLAEVFNSDASPSYRSAMVDCNTGDSFTSIWRTVFRELGVDLDELPLTGWAPEDVRFHLAHIDPPALIVLDEFDRLEDDEALTLIADTVKTLSDHIVPSTVVIVGVADSVTGLIGEHRSIDRSLVQVEMPRMVPDELRQIIDRGCETAGIVISQQARERIVRLSEGLPHFTHLLALHAAQRAVQDDRQEVALADVEYAIRYAVERHSIRSDYLLAVRSARSDHLYKEILLACALAPKDQFGYFTAGSIRDPLESIARKRIEIPAFARHLKQFQSIERGSVLRRVGEERRYFYRFADPLMQPYVILSGIAEGLITEPQFDELQGLPSLGSIPDSPNAPPHLF